MESGHAGSGQIRRQGFSHGADDPGAGAAAQAAERRGLPARAIRSCSVLCRSRAPHPGAGGGDRTRELLLRRAAAPSERCVSTPVLFRGQGRELMARKAKKRRYSRSASSDVEREMRRYKKGTAKSGPGGRGGRVKSRKQAIAIGLSEARAKGKKVPKKAKKAT